MDLIHGEGVSELFQVQCHLYKHIFSYIDSMSLKCAIQLGIPDTIHNHGQPITLQELVSKLHIHPKKTNCVHRLMRLLVHSGFFAKTIVHENQEKEKEKEAYTLTPSSRLILKDNVTSLSPFVLAMLDPALVSPWQFLGDWFQGSELTPFEKAHGKGMWDYCNQNPEYNNIFNEGMASDSRLMNLVVKDYKPIFEGLGSLVDVGGGTGTVARIISEAFPHMKCTVFDLPHVVANLPDSKNLKFVGGDMFQYIPPADAILFKWILHDWSDEECVNILKNCKEAITSKGKEGKVIVIDVVINQEKDEHDVTTTKLLFDALMMVLLTGKERNKKEWEKLFLEAGFSYYKIVSSFGMNYIDSMSLKCAIQLGIPDAIHNHGQPITLQELVSKLNIHPKKTSCVHRLMRLLVHSGFFAKTTVHENQEKEKEEEAYTLTPSSRLILKDNATSLSPFVLASLDPALVSPWQFLGDWFQGSELTPFEKAHGKGFWDYCNQSPEYNNIFNEGMASDSRLMSLVVKDYQPIFEGLGSLVDIGGGTGTVARIISEAFPHMKCTVFDLPHVVANLPDSKNLKFVGGDMFQYIPPADAMLFKSILHDWSDEECVNILKNCKEAIGKKGKEGKVIIIDVVINQEKDEHDVTTTKLLLDAAIMSLVTGKERNKREWEELFLGAGFSHYKIVSSFGMKSVIEIYP
ncbi:trans-resveratrol di-o-methyltransferase [Quercus suber]|uniref:Trans-resveratrol di-o-methyltransferase n=1 Tax=Quercus suber TaxID=58331 RepID=A0AAW0IT68_QUESU